MALTTGTDLTAILGEAARAVESLTTAQRAAKVLRDAILSGRLERGTQIGESQIAATMHVSRNTAREALRLLETEGLVLHERFRSPVVTSIEPEDVADVFWLRTVLELSAVDVIVRRRQIEDLTRIRAATQHLQRLGRTPGAPVGVESIEADREFHVALVQMAGSPRLSAAYARLDGEIRLCLAISARMHPDAKDLALGHARLLSLLERQRYAEFRAELEASVAAAVVQVTQVLTQNRLSSQQT